MCRDKTVKEFNSAKYGQYRQVFSKNHLPMPVITPVQLFFLVFLCTLYNSQKNTSSKHQSWIMVMSDITRMDSLRFKNKNKSILARIHNTSVSQLNVIIFTEHN